ncbi:hypothetical protein [Nostoc sp.]
MSFPSAKLQMLQMAIAITAKRARLPPSRQAAANRLNDPTAIVGNW